MRTFNNLLITLCGLLSFVTSSCSEDNLVSDTDSQTPVQFSVKNTAVLTRTGSKVLHPGSASTRTETRASRLATTDRIGIYMIESGKTLSSGTIVAQADNRKYKPSAEGTNVAIVPDDSNQAIYYPASGTVDFIAYYPWAGTGTSAGQINNYQYPVDLTDQSKAANYLISRNAKGEDKKAGTVTLNFSRMLSKLVMTLEAGNGLQSADLAEITPITLTAPLTTPWLMALSLP